MGLVLVPGIGVERNDAVRWIVISGIQFQPSEIMKVCFVVFIAYLICKRNESVSKFWSGLVPILFAALPVLRVIDYSRASKCDDYYSIHINLNAFHCWSQDNPSNAC